MPGRPWYLVYVRHFMLLDYSGAYAAFHYIQRQEIVLRYDNKISHAWVFFQHLLGHCSRMRPDKNVLRARRFLQLRKVEPVVVVGRRVHFRKYEIRLEIGGPLEKCLVIKSFSQSIEYHDFVPAVLQDRRCCGQIKSEWPEAYYRLFVRRMRPSHACPAGVFLALPG